MNLFYRTYGNGPKNMIIVHGLFGQSDNWTSFARSISSALPLKVFTLDLRNHGNSPHHPVFSMEALVDDLINFIKDNEIENPIVLGHSLGAKIAMHMLDEDECPKIDKLIVVDMGMRTYPMRYTHVELLTAMKETPISDFTSRKQIEDYLAQIIKSERYLNFVLKNIQRNSDDTFSWKINLESVDRHLEDILGGVEYRSAKNLPVLFLKGERSDYINDEDLEIIAKSFNNQKVVTISGTGHWLHSENPVDMEKEIKAFIG